MKRLLLLSVILMATTAVLSATPTTECSTATTLASLIAMDATGGCISQDKIFSNFAYSGGGSITAANVTVHLVAILGPNDVHGWSFNPTNNLSWTVPFTLSYDITVNSLDPLTSMFESADQINTTIRGNRVVVTDVQTGIGIGDTNPGTLTTTGLSNASTTASSTVPYADYSIHTVSTFGYGPAGSAPRAGALLSYEQDWYEQNSPEVPEPVTFVLIGSGLIGLTFLRRRSQKR